MSNTLFNEFSPVTSKQWKQKIQFDLQGADYNNALIWKTNEDISVKPFYHAEDFDALPEISQTKATKWRICQTIYVANVEKCNKIAIKAIENGAESLKFIIPDTSVSIEGLLKNIDTTATEIHFDFQFLSEEYIKKNTVIPANPDNNREGIHIHTDIIGNLAKSGNWFNNLNDDFNQLGSIVKATHTFSVDASLYQNAGANMVQQLAYTLAHANEYLNHINNSPSLRVIFEENSIEKLKVMFNVAIGSNYFFEIAKLRTLRMLWQTLASEYGFNQNCHIIATPTKRNKTLYDYNTNMLRTTTECMSAILGGSNTVCNLAHDAIFRKANTFGTRMARNQLLILKHESYFNAINNPADGTYYIESITTQLAEKALELFKDIEANGGFLKQLKEGTVQRKIKESAEKEQQQFDVNSIVLVGTNKHTNQNDKMKDALELYPFVKTNPRKTLIEPIIEKRLSETLEQKRLKNEA